MPVTMSKKETPRPLDAVVLRLYPTAGNPWTDEGGNYRVECPDCDRRMKHVGYRLYYCHECKRKWEVQR